MEMGLIRLSIFSSVKRERKGKNLENPYDAFLATVKMQIQLLWLSKMPELYSINKRG
jgi:hypothetical protein